MGPEKFTSLRKTHNSFAQEKELPKHNFAFRVDVAKLQGVSDSLMETCNTKPGMTRTVSLLGHKSENLSVYERGGISIEKLFESYKLGHPPDENSRQTHVGFHFFSEIAKFLTKRGESKAGLSSYYINFGYASNVLVRMMDRLEVIKLRDSMDGDEILMEIHELMVEWEEKQ